MRVCLVSAPTIAEFRELEGIEEEGTPRVPLGVLALAGVLEAKGQRPEVVDLDGGYARWRRAGGRGDFAREVVEDLAGRRADVYGLGTICSSYPLTLRVATALREARPGCRIVLGGPQATASAEETLAAFPAVDLIVRGEGEVAFPALLEALAGPGDPSAVPSLAYRTAGGVRRTPDAPLAADLDAFPPPAYHLYPGLRRAEALPLEAGRGCPFSCTFCSTNRFFGRRFRMKSPERLVRDMLDLAAAFGTRRFDLVHDNFTVDRRVVLAFCEAVSAAGAGLRWTCSSRTDTIDDALVEAMWRAGCRGFFFGVESGSPAMQRRIDKRLDVATARERLARVSRRRMTSTLSFITGFPDEREEDLRATVSFFVEALRRDFLEPQLSLLSPLAGTPLHARHRAELVLDDVMSDMAFQGEDQDRADRDLVARHPGLFSSFYSVPTRWLDRLELDDLRGFLNAARFQLRWLLVLAAQLEGDGLAAFRAFRRWRQRERGSGSRRRSPRALAAYYRGEAFKRDFVRFVRHDLAARHPAARLALTALARYYASLLGAPGKRPPARHPARARNVRITRIPCDGAALLACLRSGGDPSAVPRGSSTLVTRLERDRHELLQMTPEAADLLALCDGSRDERAVARAFGRLHPVVGGASAEEACAYGLALFRRKGLLAPRVTRATARAAGAARRVA